MKSNSNAFGRTFFRAVEGGSSLRVFAEPRGNSAENYTENALDKDSPQISAGDPFRFLEPDERTAVYSRGLRSRATTFEAVEKDASGAKKSPEEALRLDLRPDFRSPQSEMERIEGDNRQRSNGVERGENRILGGSDPTLSGLAAAQRLSAPGVATAHCVQQIFSLRRRRNCMQNTQRF